MGGRSSSVGNRTRKTPVGRRSTRRRARPAPKSVRKTTPRSSSRGPSPEEIQEIIKRARGAQKKPTTRRKPVARKKLVPPKITRPKLPTLRKPAVQPVRKKPTPKPAARKRPTAPKIPESVQKRIEEMMASGRMKAPTTPRKTTPRKTVAKKSAPKSVIKSAISRGGKTGDKIIAGLASSKRGKTVKGNPFLMGKSKDSDVSPSVFAIGGGYDGSGINPGMGVYRPDGTEYRLSDPDFNYKSMVKGEYLKERPTIGVPYSDKLPSGQPIVYGDLTDGMSPSIRANLPSAIDPGKPELSLDSTAPTPPVVRPTDGVQSGSFESRYVNWLASKPSGPPRRPKGMGAASKKYQAKVKKYKTDMAKWEAGKPVQPQSFGQQQQIPPTTTPTPAPAPPPTRGPILTNEPNPDLPPRFKDRFVRPMSPLGTPDMLIASNIVGQSFDPSAAMPPMPPQPPGSVFGGYGQQAPMQATAPFAGMAQANPMPIDFFPGAVPNRPTPRPDAEPVM
jgi:hypothetical protein